MKIHAVFPSANKKTGPILVTTQSSDTCPPDCGMRKACYGKFGPLGLHWRKVDAGERVTPWEAVLHMIRKQPKGAVWRMSQAGDLPGDGHTIDTDRLGEVVAANKGRRGFTYSHYPLIPHNLAAIKHAVDNGFVINLSADTLEQADMKAGYGVAPVVVPLPEAARTGTVTADGRTVIVCPNVTHGVQCIDCKLCAVADRKVIVGFPMHGTGKRNPIL